MSFVGLVCGTVSFADEGFVKLDFSFGFRIIYLSWPLGIFKLDGLTGSGRFVYFDMLFPPTALHAVANDSSN